MSWMRRGCIACQQAQQEVAYLREQLAQRDKRIEDLQDRYLAVVDQRALAAVVESRNTDPPRTWGVDETGTTVMTPQGEQDVLFDRDGEPCVQIDGELVKVSEYDHWMQRLHQAASGAGASEID